MDRKATRDRWLTNLIQANHLLEKEHCVDALRRAEMVVREAEAALGSAAPEDREWLERDVFLFQKERERFAAAYEAWKASVQARADASVAREKRIYNLPVPGVLAR